MPLVASILMLAHVGCDAAPPPPPAAKAPATAQQETLPTPAPRTPPDPPPPENRPPKINQLRVTPKEPNFGDSIHVEVEAEDPEGVGMTYNYTWKVNDLEDLTEHTHTFHPEVLHKGDRVTLTVTARDDAQDSEPVSIEVFVRGLPPVMDTSANQINKLDNVRMRAHDPDGGAITWTMLGAPAGMTIDATSGLMRYVGTETEPGGKYNVAIVATDPDGDYAQLALPMTISPGSKAKIAADDAAKKEP